MQRPTPALYCQHCGKLQTLKLIYTLPEVAWLVGKSLKAIQEMTKQKYLKFRYRYQGGKAHKVVDYFQLWDYITERLPTPEELNSGDENVTKNAIKKYVNWYARNGVKLREWREAKAREKAEAAGATYKQGDLDCLDTTPKGEEGNKGRCLGCGHGAGECQCAELGTDPEWVDYEPKEPSI